MIKTQNDQYRDAQRAYDDQEDPRFQEFLVDPDFNEPGGYMSDEVRCCPDCGSKGRLQFVSIPNSQRTYFVDGEQFIHNMGRSRGYECFNCGCEFILTAWED